MPTTTDGKSRKKAKKRYANWYERNRTALLARRKKKYREDKAHREKQVSRVRLNYWSSRPHIVLKKIRKNVKPSFTILETGEPGYGLQDVAKMFSRTTRTILFWINRKVIPGPIYEAVERKGVRVYTVGEFGLLREKAPLLAYPRKTLRESVFANTVRKEMALLRRGYLKR
jgi:hypothetical protein